MGWFLGLLFDGGFESLSHHREPQPPSRAFRQAQCDTSGTIESILISLIWYFSKDVLGFFCCLMVASRASATIESISKAQCDSLAAMFFKFWVCCFKFQVSGLKFKVSGLRLFCYWMVASRASATIGSISTSSM